MAATVDHFPLFPLGLVALPTEAVPLHVFEPRYRVMFEELLEHGGAFGIVWADEEGLRETGCACVVERLLQRHEDGRLDVLCRGTVALRVTGEVGAAPYPVAAVELLADEREERSPAGRRAAQQAYEALAAAVGATLPDDLEELGAYALAAGVELALEDKQALLELRSEEARLVHVAHLLGEALERLGRAELAQARARSNGTIRF